MAKVTPQELDWNKLGFGYRELPYRWEDEYYDGHWVGGHLTTDPNVVLNEAAQVLHYGQEVFEGLKAYRTKDGKVQLFRPRDNAKRLNNSADRLLMAHYPEEKFLEAVKAVVKANADFVPPYGSGGTLYLRPFMLGTQPLVGVLPSEHFVFRIYAVPVGAYVKGLTPTPYVLSKYDRAAPAGTGQAKTSGNYAASLLPEMAAKKAGYADTLFMDPKEHKYVDEFSGANFFGVTKDGQFVTPKSDSILPSITKRSLLQVAADLGLNPEERQLTLEDLDDLAEAGAMGTAAVISPVGSLTDWNGKKHVFYSETEVGPVTTKLYNALFDVQVGDAPDTHGWVEPVELD